MKTAAVILEPRKLPIFKKHLDAAGYTYTEQPGPQMGTLMLKVQYEWVAELKPVIEAAQKEAA